MDTWITAFSNRTGGCPKQAFYHKRRNREFAGENKPYYEQYLRTEPQFLKLKSTLTFGNGMSLYMPIPSAKSIPWFYDQPIVSQPNTVFIDFDKNAVTIQKEYAEKTLLVKDTIRRIKWKLTDETQVVAGYTCKRANGLMLDSVYIVAFYTDDIHLSGGPESFNGLPGMILKLALPHDNISWVATKVTELPADTKKLVPPKKGTLIDYKGLHAELLKGLTRAGELGRYYLKGYTL
jgi:GLPGLI family protein